MNKYPWLEEYLLNKPETKSDFKVEWGWLRFTLRGKMFAAICTPDVKYEPHSGRTMVILKCDPIMVPVFREKYPDVVPGFYSNKENWNSVYLDGQLPDSELKLMSDMSYNLVFSKLSKKLQREIVSEA
ncbi:MAG: MmcQ/YjbR family DNA-binding protein [Clostridia bacterium]